MRLLTALFLGKLLYLLSTKLRIGSGSTWTGELALRIEPLIITRLAKSLDKIILVAGTNGKTTTSKMIRTLLSGHPLVFNPEGANLINGVASSLVMHFSLKKTEATIGIFEIDEATLPLILKYLEPDVIILLNLFRDQLDRYGEVDTVVNRWTQTLKKIKGLVKILNSLLDYPIRVICFISLQICM